MRHGDCLDVLREIPDNSIDAIITDPPYGLGNTSPAQVTETLTAWLSGDREYLPGGRGFMGKAWDAFVPPVAVWDECLRVLKPGGHALVAAGSRTQDLMGLGMRLGGFELRDTFAWLYGSGFPKSMDVSKAIDKQRDEDAEPRREVARRLREALAASGKTRRAIDEHFGTANVCQYWFSPDTKTETPPADKWPWLRDFLGLGEELDAEVWRLNGRKGKPGEAWDQREIIGARVGSIGRGNWRAMEGRTDEMPDSFDITAPATDAAKAWEGWGTALKPAYEPFLLARKPLAGTVAANVLEFGTGALNIDASRIGTETRTNQPGAIPSGANNYIGGGKDRSRPANVVTGRFPANVILDAHQAAALDAQSGITKSSKAKTDQPLQRGTVFGGRGSTLASNTHEDQGGASRFFKIIEPESPFLYIPKAGKKERPVVDGVAHPTVKPLGLCEYLIEMITPPGGVVLDPFAGSGTTVEAAIRKGFDVIGIEREAEYIPLIQARIDRALGYESAAA